MAHGFVEGRQQAGHLAEPAGVQLRKCRLPSLAVQIERTYGAVHEPQRHETEPREVILTQELRLAAVGIFSGILNGVRRKMMGDRVSGRRVHRDVALRPSPAVLEPLRQREKRSFPLLRREDRSRRRFPQDTAEGPYFP